MVTKEVSTQAFTLEGASKLEPTITEWEYKLTKSTALGGEVSTPGREGCCSITNPCTSECVCKQCKRVIDPDVLNV
jgi:hypothetical protein